MSFHRSRLSLTIGVDTSFRFDLYMSPLVLMMKNQSATKMISIVCGAQ